MSEDFESTYMRNNDSNFRLDAIIVVTCALNAPLMLISVICNTVVLVAIMRTHSLRSPYSILLCSLAVSDLLVGMVVQPLYIPYHLTDDLSVHKATAQMAFIGCGVSLSTTSAIAVDRLLALYCHMRYPNVITTSRAVYLSGTLWIITFLLSFSIFWDQRIYEVARAVSVVVCFLICTICYIKIFLIVRRHQSQIQLQQQAVASLNNGNNGTMQQSTKGAKSTFIYYIVMVVCYKPLFIATLILTEERPMAWILAETFAFMNSSINPFLYCWRLSEIREAVLNTMRQILCKPIDQN